MLAVGAVAATVSWPLPSAAQEPATEDQLEDVRDQSSAVAAEIDVLEAEDAEIQAALDAVQTQIAGHQVVVNSANEALAEAESAVAASEERIAQLEAEIAELDAAAEQMIVDSFINPPINHALDVLHSETLAEATVMDALVSMQSEADARAIERLDAAQDDLEDEKVVLEDLAAEAAVKKDEADAAMADLEESLAAQQELANDIEARLNAKLAEAQSLEELDAELSEKIAAEQAALAASLQQASVQPTGSASTISEAPGGLATVTCPGGGSITVAGSIAGNLQALLEAAAADGVMLCGGGYRDPEQQIALREAHCGTSYYAIYEMPSSQCSPPTARPGTSMHEVGLAIDFTCNGGGTVSSGDSCFSWLSANAASYGLYNLPSEPWHWSTNGN
ncbi:MAG TPA: D-alanyl-D-alanine carboxypeptidase family protein [Acidimicrobiales bacterium]